MKAKLAGWTALLALGLLFSVGAPLARAASDDSPRAASAEANDAGGGQAAAEHHAPEIHFKSLGFQLLNFGVLLFLLVKFGGPPVNKALEARHEQLKVDLAAAAAARAAAEARLRTQEARLAALEQEIADIRAGVQQEADAEKARLLAQAAERAKRTREETSFAIEQQIKEAEGRLRREVALAAVDEAEQMVRRSLDARDQQRLVDTFITEVDAESAGAGGSPRGQA